MCPRQTNLITALVDTRLTAGTGADVSTASSTGDDSSNKTWQLKGASLPGIPLIISGCGVKGVCYALTPSPIDTEDIYVELVRSHLEEGVVAGGEVLVSRRLQCRGGTGTR